MEILRGVLADPAMAGHAFFYFRDPAFAPNLPNTQSADDDRKLEDLKSRIRKSGLPVRENYADPADLGKQVLQDMSAIINSLFPEGSQPDPLDREAMDHAAYARSRAGVYIGREEYYQRLDSYAASTKDEDDKPLAILGESGSGKSALLANWAQR